MSPKLKEIEDYVLQPIIDKIFEVMKGTTMYQKYGSDPTRNLLVDKVENAAIAYEKARLLLKEHDQRKEINDGELEPKHGT